MKSTMKAVLCFVLSLGSVAPDMAGECNMAGFYLELGCTPAATDAKSACPTAFTCPDLYPDKSMCYYRGTAYGVKSSIPQNLVLNPCSQACRCLLSPSGMPKFDCAAADCVESYDSDINEQCIFIYELDSCCSTGKECGKDAIAKLSTCDVDGQTYYQGQTFEPSNTRKSCICTPEWDGKVENQTYCRDINCGLEIHYQEKIAEKCAPVFSGNDRSCPIGFECPSETTNIVRGLNIRDITEQCSFGNQTLSVGDEVSVEEKCVKCTCKVPPFVSCSRINSCDD